MKLTSISSFVFIISIFLLTCKSNGYGNCTDTSQKLILKSQKSFFEIDSLKVHAWPAVDGNPARTLSHYSMGIYGLMERDQAEGYSEKLCKINKADASSNLDPSGQPLGPLLQFLQMEDMDCTMKLRKDYPFEGIDTVTVSYWKNENLLSDAHYSLSNASRRFPISNNTDYTNGETMYSSY